MNTQQPDKLLSIREASEFLSVSRSTLTRWIKKDLIPIRHLPSGRVRVSLIELEALTKKTINNGEYKNEYLF